MDVVNETVNESVFKRESSDASVIKIIILENDLESIIDTQLEEIIINLESMSEDKLIDN